MMKAWLACVKVEVVAVATIVIGSAGATSALPADYELISENGKYRLSCRSLGESSTGTLSLIDEHTSAVLAKTDVVPGKLRAAPVPVWRNDSVDVAIGLSTWNASSPAYIFCHTHNAGHVAVQYGRLDLMAGYLGFLGDKSKVIVRAQFTPYGWENTGGTGHQIVNMRNQCWTKNGQRYSGSEPVLVDANGKMAGR